MKLIAPLLFAGLAVCATLGRSAAAETDWLELEAAYVSALGETAQPMEELLERYRDSLRALAARAQESGNLEEMLAAQREAENAEAPGEREFASPELARLRGIFEANAAGLEKEEIQARLRLHQTYLERLRSGVEDLTRANRVDEALRLDEKRRRLKALIEEETPLGGEVAGTAEGEDLAVLWELRSRAGAESVNDCEIRSDGDRLVLSSPRPRGWSHVRSRREFRPPFRLDARAATDSTNIRFYYDGKVLAILNWEVNLDELRLHNPATQASVGIRGKGRIPQNEMQDVEVDVLPDRVILRVNGEVRGELAADNADLRGPVGIGPAFGSVVSLERFRVLALE